MALPVSPKNTLGIKRARRKKGGGEKRNCTLGLNLYSGSPLARSPMCPKNVAVLTRVFCTRKCMAVVARRPKKVVFLCIYQCNAGGGSGGGEAGHGVGIWLFSKICNQIPCPRANHSSQMQPNFPTSSCTLLSIPRQDPRKAQLKYLQMKLCNLL